MSYQHADTEAAELLCQFRQAFTDVNLSPEEAQQLRHRLADYGQAGGALSELRHQLFNLARERFNTFKDKAVIEWLEEASALLPEAATATATPTAHYSEVHFSPVEKCVAAIRDFLNQAQHTLDLCVFTIADDRLTEAVLAAHQRGVRVRLLTDNDKLYDRGSDVRQLHQAGVTTRIDQTAYHMHHKFAVTDNRTALTGSYNWTRSAAEYNMENLLITQDPVIVRRYEQEFNRLWEVMTPFAEASR
ncbi:phospholipase D-like domain-containing protein [Hymenobacter sp. AT01-02]|uniref:phospholipase D-like domain-containing protein n=1 Tax=Hymenobacter sp. AT01-02 TaxID=1571877 RepID=UPI0005F1765C|nr:phospholipase D-like domain-containing protein [Hymenobacter sp. AT01-02]